MKLHKRSVVHKYLLKEHLSIHNDFSFNYMGTISRPNFKFCYATVYLNITVNKVNIVTTLKNIYCK